MPRFFTHYWYNQTWEWNRGFEGDALDHLAGNLFRKRKVGREDFVYIVTVRGGQLYLGGRMQIDEIISRDQAVERLGTDDLWDAEDQVIAIPGSGTSMRFNRVVPIEIVKRVRCVTGSGEEGLFFRAPTKLDGQTLRGVRELTLDSAKIFDALIGSTEDAHDASDQGKNLDRHQANEISTEMVLADPGFTFDPSIIEDERTRNPRSIVQRLGQADFRKALLAAYDGRCVISGCGVERTLQAAHIVPFRGPATNHVSNGLLLRADLHNLFDSFLLSIDPETLTVRIALSLRESPYGEFAGKKVADPIEEDARPNRQALERHFDEFSAYEIGGNEITDEELEQVRNDPRGYTTAEVLAHLNSL